MLAAPQAGKAIRLLVSDGEFHSARRQFARWAEDGLLVVDTVPALPFDSFTDRFLAAAQSGDHDLIFVSQILFSSGRSFDAVDRLASLGRPDGPWVVIDGYHAFMAVPEPLGAVAAKSAFYLGGGYKYAMAGEGAAFLHAPPGFGERPPITGWYAEFEDLTLPPGMVGYAPDAMRFMGATFDPSGLYRFNAVRRMLDKNGLDTARISAHCDQLKQRLVDTMGDTVLAEADLLNPPGESGQARFLAFRHAEAARWSDWLKAKDCITDVRGDVLRVGFGLYQDMDDVDAFVRLVATMR